jgi:hypothetical protein
VKPTIVYLILLGILLGSSVNLLGLANDDNYADNLRPISICYLVSNAAAYDGKEITIRGLYRSVAHGTILMGSASCTNAEINLRLASDYKEEKSASRMLTSLIKRNRFQPVVVIVRATFWAAKEGNCFGQICASYEIETHELLSAKPYDPDSPWE